MSKQMLFESKKKIKLNDLSDLLKIKKSTIKSWEKEFNLSSLSAESTQKLYSEQEVKLIKLIKTLLYEEKLSYQEIQERITLFLSAETEKTFNPAQSLEEDDTIKDEAITLLAVDPIVESIKEENIIIATPIEIKEKPNNKEYKEKLESIKNRLLALQEKLK